MGSPAVPIPISSVASEKQLFCPACGLIMVFDPTQWAVYSGVMPNASVYLWPSCPIDQTTMLNSSGASGGIPGDGQ